MWVEPDLNMPDGESLTRQILIGKRYFQSRFGVDVKIGWNPDSFGYNWQLPQIYSKSGMTCFVTQKLLWAHEYTTFPYKLFYWQAPDGSRLLTYFPRDYAASIEGPGMAKDLSVWAPAIYGSTINGSTLSDSPAILHLYGVGDHGGGPTRQMLDNAAKLTSPGTVFPRFEFGTASGFFENLEKKLPTLNVPTWNGELYFQYHRGVFTTQAETKQRIRRSEETMLNAEKFASLELLDGRAYPQEEMNFAWKRLLFDDFHDIMPGSGIGVNYLDARRNLQDVDRAGNGVIHNSLEEISAHVNTQGDGVPVMVFNSLSWARAEVIEVEAQLPGPARDVFVTDAQRRGHAQLLSIDPETHRARFLLLAYAPPFGYNTYFVQSSSGATRDRSDLRSTSDTLENAFVRVQIDPKTGCMTMATKHHIVTVGLIQMRCTAQPPANLKHGLALVEKAAKRGAQIVCLPELFRSLYFCQTEDHRQFALAEPIPGRPQPRSRMSPAPAASPSSARSSRNAPPASTTTPPSSSTPAANSSAAIARCISPTIRSTTRNSISRRAISASNRSPPRAPTSARSCVGTSGTRKPRGSPP